MTKTNPTSVPKSQQKLNVAVIGAGIMGKNHIRLYSDMEGVNLAAVCDESPEALSFLKSKYKVKTYTDYHIMLKDLKLDAVSICVPTKLHYKVASEFINSGMNVLIEKPLTETTTEARKLIELARQKKVKLFVGHIERFNPVVQELKKRLSKNELGKIYKISSFRLSPFPQRILDVGVTVDLAVHEIDIINYLTGSRLKHVYAETAQRIHSKNEDLLVALLRFENDILGVINCNWLTPKKVREIQITGERGMFFANYLTQELYFYENEFAREDLDYSKGPFNVVEGNMIKVKLNVQEPLRQELNAFIRCVRENSQPEVTGEDGLHAINVAEKLVESARLGNVVKID